MRAVRFDSYGGVDVLEVRDVEDPQPGEGQLLVRVKAAGINPGEAKIREGELHSRFPATFPSGQGSDLAGVVAAVGPNVAGFAQDDEVVGFTNDRASHAELALVSEAHAVSRPAAVPWEVAGGLFVAGATAHAMVDAISAGPGDVVLVTGATGGVGTLAVQLAKLRGATVIGVASSRHADWLERHEVIHVEYGDGVEERISQAAGASPNALLDCVGGGYVDLALGLGVAPERIDTIVDFEAAQEHGVKTDGNAQGANVEVLEDLVRLLSDGRLELPVARTFPLEQVRDAYEALEHDHPLGKIVLVP